MGEALAIDDPELAALIAERKTLEAVRRHRTLSGSSLAEAVAYVRAHQPPGEPVTWSRYPICLLSLGPYLAGLPVTYGRHYGDVPEGTEVLDESCCAETLEDEASLLAAFGVTDPSFATLPVTLEGVDRALLAAWDPDMLEKLEALAGAGHVFFLRRIRL